MAAHRCCSLLSYRTPMFPFSYYSPASSSCNPIPSYPHHLLRLSQLPPPASLLHRRPSPPISLYRHDDDNNCNRGSRRLKSSFAAAARKREETVQEEGTGDATKGSGSSARGRRLLKVREEKRKREHERLHNYPPWAKILENACRDDSELRAVLGDSIGNPELMRQRVEGRVRTKGRDFRKSKTGSMLAFKVSFRDFNPTDSFIWFELYGAPSDRDVELLGSVVQSWYVMGRLGAFNSTNLQLANSSMDYNPLYDADKTAKAMPSSFHDISDVEFQDNWGRVWVDLGTSDFFAVDVLLNCLAVLSSEYLGIQQVVFGGRHMGDWEEGMTSIEYGYKHFKI